MNVNRLPMRQFIAALSIVFGMAIVDGKVLASGYHDGSEGEAAWGEAFPPEDYNPYDPNSDRTAQQLMPVVPVAPVVPSPVYAPAVPAVAPQPVAPALGYPTTGYGVTPPAAIIAPSAPAYPPALYSPAPGLYPGYPYTYPYNNNQILPPYFW